MKQILIFILLASSCFGAWDAAKPSSSTSLRNSNPEILANWSALEVAISQDHTFTTGSPDGKHAQITFTDPISTPSFAANEAFLYSKNVSAVTELHWLDESNNELQLTSGGGLFSSTSLAVTTTLTVTGESTFNNHINLGADDDLLLSTTSDITISGNTFTVAGATGNTLVAGTLDVTGNIDPTTYETTNGGFLDEDTLSSDSDTKVASQQSVKAYADALGGSGKGFVKGWIQWNSGGTVQGTPFNATVSRGSLGNYVIVWGTDFANDDYVIIPTVLNSDSVTAVVLSVATTGCTVRTFTSSSGAAVDSAGMAMAIGDQ